MKFVLALILAFSMLLTIIFFTTIQIHVHAGRKGKDDLIKTRIKAWFGLIRFQNEFSVIKLSEDFSGIIYQMELESPSEPLDQKEFKLTPNETMQLYQRIYNWIKNVYMMNKIIKKFLRSIRVDKFNWRTGIGSGDAAETGTITGIIWGVKASMIGLFSSYVTLRAIPRIHVQPFFNEKRLETEFEGIFRLRIGNAMLAGIRILLNLRKRRDSKWQNTLFKA